MIAQLSAFYAEYPYIIPIVALCFFVMTIYWWLQQRATKIELENLRYQLTTLQENHQKLLTEHAVLIEQKSTLQDNLDSMSAELSVREQSLQERSQTLERIKIDFSALDEQRHLLTQQLEEQSQKRQSLEQQLLQTNNEKNKINTALETLKVAYDAEKKHSSEKLQELEKNRNLLKQEFENLANNILKTSQKEFKQQSLNDMDLFLKPFKQQVSDFKEKVETIHSQDLKQRSELKQELVNLQELNKDITNKAEELTSALKGQKKTQGNWGELILENVLDRSGLLDGKDFKRQQQFTNTEGKHIPDVVVYLPEEKHLVIDAKVSLNAYTRFVNSDDTTEREQAIKEHVAAVSARIKELSDKNYYDLPELNSPEMVFMFIPIESAFVEAVKADESLFQQAIEQKILIATPTTLLTSLNIIRQLWRFEDQNKHSALLAAQAGKIFNKLASILEGLDRLGAQMDKSKEIWAQAMGQFVNGKGNLVKQVKDFEKMGVSVQKELPAKWVEQSQLEMKSE